MGNDEQNQKLSEKNQLQSVALVHFCIYWHYISIVLHIFTDSDNEKACYVRYVKNI